MSGKLTLRKHEDATLFLDKVASKLEIIFKVKNLQNKQSIKRYMYTVLPFFIVLGSTFLAVISFAIAERGFLFDFLKTWERILFS